MVASGDRQRSGHALLAQYGIRVGKSPIALCATDDSQDPASAFDLARAREVASGGSRRFWSSLEELIDEEGFRAWLAGEFPAASSMFDDPGRRQFLKLMGASLLLAGLTGCGESKSDHALPYVNQPDDMLPGVPRYYATGILFDGHVQPVIATTYAGRRPSSTATRIIRSRAARAMPSCKSAIFGLYDPERSKVPSREGVPSTWNVFRTRCVADMRARWRERGGDGLRILTGATTSPTLVRQLGDFAKQYPKMRWSRFEPIGWRARMKHEAGLWTCGYSALSP